MVIWEAVLVLGRTTQFECRLGWMFNVFAIIFFLFQSACTLRANIDSLNQASKTAPIITMLSLSHPSSSPSTVLTPTVRVSGVAADEVVKLFSDASCTNLINTGTATSDTIELSTLPLTEGTHRFYSTSTNSIGTSDCSVLSVEYILDLTAPVAPTGIALESPASSPANDSTPTFTVSGVVSGDTVNLYSDSLCTTLVGSTVATDISASVTSLPLLDGTYGFYVRTQDAAGNASSCSSVNVSYTLDATPPAMPTGVALGDTYLSLDVDTKPKVVVSGVSIGDVVKLYSNTSCTTEVGSGTATATTIEFNSTTLVTGNHEFRAKTFDALGNGSACSSANAPYVLDTVAEVTIDEPVQITTEGSGADSFVVRLSAAKNYAVAVYYNLLQTTATSSQHNLTSGSVTIPAGQTSVSIPYTITTDTATTGTRALQINLYKTDRRPVVLGFRTQSRHIILDAQTTLTGISKLSLASKSGCAVLVGGVLKCWGASNSGGLYFGVGDATTNDRTSAVVVNSGTNYLDVSRSSLYACGITAANVLRCWGANWSYQLGDTTATSRTSPVTIDSGNTYSSVSAGGGHTCGITTTGVLKCWGANTFGNLGDNSTTTRTAPVIIDSVTYSSVSANGSFTCGITTTGILKCWGRNNAGQLGQGNTTDSPVPLVVDSGTTYQKVSVQGDQNPYVCAITTAGAVKCWGANSNGTLGDGTTTNRTSPVLVDSGTSYQSIATSLYATCGVTTGNRLKCWGKPYSSNNTLFAYIPGVNTQSLTPIEVLTKLSVASVEMGSSTTDNGNTGCVITTGGQYTCWGHPGWGSGMIHNMTSAIDVDPGVTYSLLNDNCAKTSAGELKCWGLHPSLGNGAGYIRNVPTSVKTDKNFTALFESTGGYSRCAGVSGKPYCWGSGAYSFGHGEVFSTTNYSVPRPLPTTNLYSDMAFNSFLSGMGIIASTGALKIWGRDYNPANYGYLGLGVVGTASTTQDLDSATSYAKISYGYDYGCGVSTTGTLKCWGANGFGQLGDGTTTSRNTPTTIDGATTYSNVRAGFYNTCGITTAGVLKCWGYGASVGDGGVTQRNSPVIVDAGTSYSKLSTTGYSFCGLTSTGVAKCWGQSTTGHGSIADRTSPVVVDSGTTYTELASTGTDYVGSGSKTGYCGITSTGALKCWGTHSHTVPNGHNGYLPIHQINGIQVGGSP